MLSGLELTLWLPCERDRLRPRVDRERQCAANPTPVKAEMNRTMPQACPRHTTHVSHNLLEATNLIRHRFVRSRSLHNISNFLSLTKRP